MKFSLISDMHVDFPQQKTPYDLLEENVIVAGDTGNGLVGLKFLNKLRRKGHKVFAIDGNHEHYANQKQGRTPEETVVAFRVDNPNLMDMDGISVIGTNGWYPVNNPDPWYRYMNDGEACFDFYPQIGGVKVNSLCEQEYLFLQEQLAAISKPCIVVTHTAPCLETLNPEYEGSFTNEWYYNPLMYRLLERYQDKILVWCHGHTHASNEAIVNGVRVVCNPRGYPGENPNWKPLTVEVGY